LRSQGLFTLDVSTGEIKTRKLLTGKGRQRPYRMLIRALDKGQPSLSSDAPLDIYISDVASNDGVPIFLRPMPNETAFVAEVFLFLQIKTEKQEKINKFFALIFSLGED
jgi:hypothetical protein